LISMRFSSYLLIATLCILAFTDLAEAKKKPSKGKKPSKKPSKGKGKPTQGNQEHEQQPAEEPVPIVAQCKNEPAPPMDLTLDHAQWMIKAAMSRAEELSIPVTICIRDRHDNLVAHIRMRNAFLGSVDLACQKARTSALFPAPSSAIAENGALQLSNGIISGVQGALPLVTSQGAHLGSVGVSGAYSGEMDEEIAKVAADMLSEVLNEVCYLDKWTATGEVPNKLSATPPAVLDITFNNKTISTNDMVTTDDMLDKPTLNWKTESDALYTIFFIDFGIERLEGLQFVHWLVTNVKDGSRVEEGDEVEDYIPPFYFKVKEDFSGLDLTQRTRGHDIMALVYKQRAGEVDMADERQSGCNAGLGDGARIHDHAAIAEKYDLELVAGNFFFTTYTEATNDLLCYFTKCTGAPFPLPAPGINDGADCQ